MSIDVSQLKQDIETVLVDAESVGYIIEDIPGVPAEIKNFIAKAETVLKDVQGFLA